MIKLLVFDNLFSSLRHFRLNPSEKNDAGSRARTTLYWENLVLVVVPVLKSQGRLFKQSLTQAAV